ncbi:FAD:protein FMN transferase [Marinobacter caseinilyticus]|uniref:FAD:protein FMN transferase n=1 Tax=Marinobacter caseinilyticus TaxID=2692195 RepID=UPI0031F395B9
MIRPALVVTVLVIVTALAGCSFEPEEKIWEISGPVFGTQYHIDVVLTDDPDQLETLSSGISDILDSIDASMSTWRPDSELSRFNNADDQSQWFPVSEPFYEVLAAAQEISEFSQGAFDITVGPVVNLWGFGPEARPNQVPEPSLLENRLQSIGYEKLELRSDPDSVRALSRQYLDLSAIAKGYAVDAVAAYLSEIGVEAYLVEIGGEVRVHGRKPNGEAWRLAIESPVDQKRQISRVVALESRAMATSGDYRNYYESAGKRYSHTINPETGRPIEHNLASVTVIADTTMRADALATAFNVMGYERANALAVRENIAVYFIIRGEQEFEVHYTPAFSSYLTK